MTRRFHQRFLKGCLGLGLALVTNSSAMANPTDREPARPLAAHGTIEGAKELVARLYQLRDQEAAFVEKTHARKNDPTSFSDSQISASAGRLWKARRDAKHLQQMGEPAGQDLFRQFQTLAIEVYQFGQAYRGTPRGTQLVQRLQTKLQREQPQMQRFLQQGEAALEQGKLEAFLAQMEKKGEELTAQLVFFPVPTARVFEEAFNTLLAKGDVVLEKQRRSQYAQQAAAVMAKEWSVVGRFEEEAGQIARELASGSWRDQPAGSGGPVESFVAVGQRWGVASAALHRGQALQWVFPTARTTAQEASPMKADELKQLALRALTAVVESAAESTPVDQVQVVYSGLLEAISVLDRRSGINSTAVARACEPAMAKLAAKEPSLPQRIANYERATSEVLRWRQAYASQQAEYLGRNASRAGAVLARSGETAGGIRPNFARLPQRESVAAPVSFSDPAVWMVQEAAARLVDQDLIEDRLVRLSPTARIAVSPLSQSHYANVPVSIASDAEIADLLAALVVDDVHGPLSAAAAEAVSAARWQDYETVMGRIEAVSLESIVTRMIGLPDSAYPLVNLGNPVILVETVAPMEQTLWRLDVRPLWARHRCFVVRATDDGVIP